MDYSHFIPGSPIAAPAPARAATPAGAPAAASSDPADYSHWAPAAFSPTNFFSQSVFAV